MNYLDYFDYIKVMLNDLKQVSSPESKSAIYDKIFIKLDEHKKVVQQLITQINEERSDFASRLKAIASNKTPKSVLDVMKEFGFKDLEECENDSPPYLNLKLEPYEYKKILSQPTITKEQFNKAYNMLFHNMPSRRDADNDMFKKENCLSLKTDSLKHMSVKKDNKNKIKSQNKTVEKTKEVKNNEINSK